MKGTKVRQNIFDNESFFNGYRNLRRRDTCYNNLLEQPAMEEMLPDLKDKSVLDIGCGYGHNCLDFIKRGANKAVGIDISEKMLAVAKKESSHPNIEYRRMDMAEISSLNMKFDLVYSSLAFHYAENFKKLMEDIFKLLNDFGTLLYSQEHPINTAPIDEDVGHFNLDENGNKVSYTFSDYNRSGIRKIHWFGEELTKYHRPMGEILTSIAHSGFVITNVTEPLPKPWAVEKLPTIVKEYIKPNFLIIKAVKNMF